MTTANPQPLIDDEINYCAVHTEREATLRCNKCDRWMCVSCAVQTPVGYRCRECARQQQAKFFTANATDGPILFAVCAVLTGIGAAIISAIGGWLYLSIVLGFPVGGAISEAALRATGKRRGKYHGYWGAAGAAVGGLAGGIIQVYLQLSALYARALREMPADAIRQLEEAGETFTPSLDLALQYVFNNIGLLVFIGIVAALIFVRYRPGKLI